MHPLIIAAIGAGGGPKVNITAGPMDDLTLSPANDTQNIVFNSDGTIDDVSTTGGTVQWNAATDWIMPNAAASSDYDVRYTGLTGDAFTTSAAAEDTWIDLGSNRTWGYTTSSDGVLSGTCTFEIRNASGTTVASSSMTITAERAV